MRYTLLLSLTLLLGCVETSPLAQMGPSKAVSTEQFSDLEAEYAAFSTQALTFNYITRKVHHWIHQHNGEGMRREIAFARVKHPQLFKNAVKTSESLCLQTLSFPEVQLHKDFNPDFEAYTHEFICVPPRGNYNNALGMGFNTLPAGTFIMGSVNDGSGHLANERPQHTVQLSAFQMQRTEVTQAQWQAVMGTGNWPGYPANEWSVGSQPNETYGLGPNYPMYYVNWCDIVGVEGNAACVGYTDSFLKRLNENHGGSNPYKGDGTDKYRLPTEAEWEYAARAGTSTDYACAPESGLDGSSVECLKSMAWYWDEADPNWQEGSHLVGRKEPNAWGLYDMHGNVREWVQDRYSGTYYSETVANPYPRMNPTGPISGSQRVVRGATWSDLAYGQRVSLRGSASPSSSIRGRAIGFRLVRAFD